MSKNVHPDHPTLFYARDIKKGWTLLNYPPSASPVRSVEKTEDRIWVTFEDDKTDSWGLTDDDRVHARLP